ncbi:MAG: hypothetical protein C4K47_09420 [Candidatus Thorarchaeota archaeon]|nr:MAG: hypothetical protein C4K47_09420 [Candidatus Thorarchaeota archaeon]
MEVTALDGNWFHIARAEFQVQTSGIRTHRRIVVSGSIVLGIIWALLIAPTLIGYVLTEVLEIPRLAVAMVMPGLMRAGIMFIWLILLIPSLSNALQEVKVGQWEILLSNRVKTREILVGTFVGRLAIYGLCVLYLAPLLVAPFAHALAVSSVGLALMYFTVFVVTVSTIWLSNLVGTAIQSKLGASSRGKDLAKALALVLSPVAVFPLLGLQLFAPMMSEILGLDVFLLFPFTWGADLVTQIAVIFNGIGPSMEGLVAVLGLGPSLSLLLLGGFSIFVVLLGLYSADRFFIIGEGARTESVTTIHRENIVLRGVRRISSGSFGVLIVTGLKDFGRKAENLARLALLMALALLLPFFVFIRAGEFELTSVAIMMSLMLGFLGVQVFGGVGFLESKDQLWTIQATPHGVQRYVKAKAIQCILLIVPVVLLPSVLYAVVLRLNLSRILFLLSTSFISCLGGAFVGIGIAAGNPTYEDTKSGAYITNIVEGMGLVVVSSMSYLIAGIALSMLGFNDLMNYIRTSESLYILAQVMPLPIIGLLVILIGQHRLSNLE